MEKKNTVLIVIAALLLAGILCACGTEEAAASSVSSSDTVQGIIPHSKIDTITVDPTGQKEGYSAVLYDNTNGLPTSEANDIAMTSEGFLWIGSYSGLIRYDGNTFERIDSSTGVASVVCLFVDHRDRLWVGTNDTGAAVMQKDQFKTYRKSDGLGSSSIRSIAEDPEGNIYLATTKGISVIGPDMALSPMKDAQIQEANVRELRLGNDGVLYGVTMHDEVFTIQNGRLTGFHNRDALSIEEIISVLPDPERPGYVYLGTEGSTVYYGSLEKDMKGAKAIDAAPLAYISSIERYQDQLWLCADNGIGIVTKDGVERLDNVPMDDSAEHVMTDYEGNLWFTSSRQGVMKLVPNRFSDLFARYHLSSTVVNTTCMYRDQLFIGTDEGLTVLDRRDEVDAIPLTDAATASGRPLEETDLLQLLKGCRIRSIIRDNRDQLWISTYTGLGLVRYNGSSVTIFTSDDGLPSNRVRAVKQRKDGTYMVACNGGVALIREDRVVRVYNETFGLSNTAILSVEEAENGDMLCGSDGDGLYVIQNDSLLRLGTEDGLASEIVMRIKKDPNRDLFWIITSNSLAFMTPDYKITTVKHFPYSNNFDLFENSKEDMWVLSSNGIYVLPTEELLNNGPISPVHYSSENGLPCITTANSYSELTEDGNLYISGTSGVAKVNLEDTFDSVNELKMAVPYVEADGKFFYADRKGTITIPPGVQKVTIFSYVYTYSLLNPQVTYHLEGFERKTTTVNRTELAPVDYTNLKGGSYRFVMQITDSMGRGKQEISVPIVKTKSIQEYLWFQVLQILLGMALVAGVVLLYYRRKTRALERKHRENQTFIREMTEAFAKTIDMKDEYTNGHSIRVAQFTSMLATEMGCDRETVEKYYYIALLHDIGKISVPAELLNKPGKLTDEEFRVIRSHSIRGYNVLKDISIMPELAIGAEYHHERPDGKGYPDGLTGEQIPLVAKIISVADAFDAMYSKRPYRDRMNFDRVVSIIRNASGSQMDADVVSAFLRLVAKGEFRAPDDDGGGATEDIDNIRNRPE